MVEAKAAVLEIRPLHASIALGSTEPGESLSNGAHGTARLITIIRYDNLTQFLNTYDTSAGANTLGTYLPYN